MASSASVKVPGAVKSTAWKGYAKGIAQTKSAPGVRPMSGPAATPILTVPKPIRQAYPATLNPAPSQGPAAPAAPSSAGSTPLDLAGLTGDQQAAYITAWAKYQNSLTGLGQSTAGAATTRDQNTAAENKGYTANTEAENANMAARGMFSSSIRDGALNDLDATHVMNLNNIGANYQAAINQINSNVGNLNTDWGAEQGLMDWYRIQNSQAATPPTGPAPAPPTPTGQGYPARQATATQPSIYQGSSGNAWKGYARGIAQTKAARR